MLKYLFATLLLVASTYAAAIDSARPAYVPPPPAVSTGGIIQIIFSLLLVLAAIVLIGWILKRMKITQQGSGSLLKVLGGVSVGQRERIVLVEINDTWMVIGVGPGQIRTLHTLQKPEDAFQESVQPSPSGSATTENKFASLLSSVLSSGKGKAK